MKAPHGARLQATLKAVAAGVVTRSQLAERTGWAEGVVIKALENARNFKLLAFNGEMRDGERCHALTEMGRMKLGAFNAMETSPKLGLAEQARALIADTPAGMDTQALAHELHVEMLDVDEALLPLVQAQQLVACAFTRYVDGKPLPLKLYRESAGLGPRRDFSLRPNPVGVIKPGWFGQKLAAPASDAGPEDAEAAAEPVHAELPEAEAPGGLPLLGTLDMDAADRAAAAAAGRADPAEAFNCALWSTGHMVIRSRGQELRLEPEHAEALLHYVACLRADRLLANPGLAA